MHFSLVYQGYIPSQGDKAQKDIIRGALQAQLAALYAVTSRPYKDKNKVIIGDTRYTAILPVTWLAKVEVILLRSAPPQGIGAMADIDNLLKTLLDSLCPPVPGAKPKDSPYEHEQHVLVLDDKQLTEISASSDYHWAAKHTDDLAIIRVRTSETPIDEKVALGGHSLEKVRAHVF